MESKLSQVPKVSRICCASKIRYLSLQRNEHLGILSIKKEGLKIFQHKLQVALSLINIVTDDCDSCMPSGPV